MEGGLLASSEASPPDWKRYTRTMARRPNNARIVVHRHALEGLEVGQVCAQPAPPPQMADVQDSDSGAVELHL